VAEALEYGLVGVNDAAGYTHEIPFGGFKESGLGREGGHEGLEEYLETKSVVVGLPPARG
jgi:succinate-semialdehyde dehydrogenase/glutarate-semialdehyde dehydrogenase